MIFESQKQVRVVLCRDVIFKSYDLHYWNNWFFSIVFIIIESHFIVLSLLIFLIRFRQKIIKKLTWLWEMHINLNFNSYVLKTVGDQHDLLTASFSSRSKILFVLIAQTFTFLEAFLKSLQRSLRSLSIGNICKIWKQAQVYQIIKHWKK